MGRYRKRKEIKTDELKRKLTDSELLAAAEYMIQATNADKYSCYPTTYREKWEFERVSEKVVVRKGEFGFYHWFEKIVYNEKMCTDVTMSVIDLFELLQKVPEFVEEFVNIPNDPGHRNFALFELQAFYAPGGLHEIINRNPYERTTIGMDEDIIDFLKRGENCFRKEE